MSIIDELVIDKKAAVKSHNKRDQSIFMENDDLKMTIALRSRLPVFMDRGPISTLTYNIVKWKLSAGHDYTPVLEWYIKKHQQAFLRDPNIIVIYLTHLKTKPSTSQQNDPYGSNAGLDLLTDTYSKLLPLLNPQYIKLSAEDSIDPFNEVLELEH